MSTSPLHYKNNEEEIYEITSLQDTEDGFRVEFNYGPVKTSKNADLKLEVKKAEVIFYSPVRLDYYSDEGFNQSFVDVEKFEKLDKNFPGVIFANESVYLNDYKIKEEWASICHEQNFRHFVVWSYWAGVIHILSDIDPIIKSVN